MKPIRSAFAIVGIVFGLLTGGIAGGDEAKSPAKKGDSATQAKKAAADASRIQLAILLDTSGSMDGLINQARTQLWKIVNELATARRGDQAPDLQVALYEYGKNSIPREQGHLRMIVPFTDDLDKISAELFALTTNGGQEYCGQVIGAATKELKWSESDQDLKLLFICGNEPFTQGEVNYKEACEAAIAQGITVNTIFCGPEAEGIRTGWRDGAQLADGSFLSINQDRQVAAIRTPFDEKLAELSNEVNRTYVAFGETKKREELQRRQVEQDAAAKNAAPAAAAERASFKASGLYRASAWDLIDAVKNGKVKLEELKDEDLPQEMRKLSLDEKKAYLKKKEEQRGEVQKEIQSLSEKRNKFIADERKKQAAADKENTLDEAIIQTVRTQAAKKNFEVGKE